ncbi:HD domain-containing protein [Kurthia senegalensis]|uniref:HD domain-containing protein n=1 Tax=Kurthia senegalensis TaxID=1033740 RepID=UPI000288346B|nr:HD domain-containing protein [Kurthia senegalensis]
MNAVEQCAIRVKDIYNTFDGSHDFLHIERVLANARQILKTEVDANQLVIELAVLLHDVSDPKYSQDKQQEQTILNELPITEEERVAVKQTIAAVSYRGGHELEATTIEMKIVRDADRLDAIGAIGIARAFTFGGAKDRPLYDDVLNVQSYEDEAAYRQAKGGTITHFYEKLLHLKELMTTSEGRKIAEGRHAFMLQFLDQFKQEREGQL